MAEIFRKVYEWLMRRFWATEMEVTIIGLQNAGKTSLIRVLSGDEFEVDTIPTVGFNMRRLQRGHVSIKCWDLGGQPRFRSMWERYCRGANAIVFVVDIADHAAIPFAYSELQQLMANPMLEGIPLLVLGNKCDLAGAMSTDELIDALKLSLIDGRDVCCYAISAKEEFNLKAVIDWLIQRSSR